jgi:hypothetical protein
MFQLQLLLRDDELLFVPSLQEVQHTVLGIVDAVLQAGQSVEDLGAKVSIGLRCRRLGERVVLLVATIEHACVGRSRCMSKLWAVKRMASAYRRGWQRRVPECGLTPYNLPKIVLTAACVCGVICCGAL